MHTASKYWLKKPKHLFGTIWCANSVDQTVYNGHKQSGASDHWKVLVHQTALLSVLYVHEGIGKALAFDAGFLHVGADGYLSWR